jgi:hypothetical protein
MLRKRKQANYLNRLLRWHRVRAPAAAWSVERVKINTLTGASAVGRLISAGIEDIQIGPKLVRQPVLSHGLEF